MVSGVARSTRGEDPTPAVAPVDPAVLRARRVVGLYGDPDVTWSVVVAVDLDEEVALDALSERARMLVEAHPHLGAAPPVRAFGARTEAAVLAAFADEPYGDRDPLLRVALSEDARTLVVAAHHGAIDGLGLLGAASVLLDVPLASTARGVGPDAEPRGFVRYSARRLVEAVFDPPARIRGDRRMPEASGDWLEALEVDARRPGSAALVRAAVDLVGRAGATRRRGVVVSMGLSRRPGAPVPDPDRDTAYVRLRADGVDSTRTAHTLLARTTPEPAFPASDGGGLGPRAARLLSSRLGATVLVSNLGRIDHPAVVAVRFWPVPTGPAGVCLGLASTGRSTTLTLRARRGWFSAATAARLAGLAAECLAQAAQ
jgi:hypothetical protein